MTNNRLRIGILTFGTLLSQSLYAAAPTEFSFTGPIAIELMSVIKKEECPVFIGSGYVSIKCGNIDCAQQIEGPESTITCTIKILGTPANP